MPKRQSFSGRADDLTVYKTLVEHAGALDSLAARAWSPRSARALSIAARVVRRLASAIYQASLR